MVQFLSLLPFLIVQLGPITTFGPILQPYSTIVVLSISVFNRYPVFIL